MVQKLRQFSLMGLRAAWEEGLLACLPPNIICQTLQNKDALAFTSIFTELPHGFHSVLYIKYNILFITVVNP